MSTRTRIMAVVLGVLLLLGGYLFVRNVHYAISSIPAPKGYPTPRAAADAYAKALARDDTVALENIVGRRVVSLDEQRQLAGNEGSSIVELVPEDSDESAQTWKVGGPPTDVSDRAETNFLYLTIELSRDEWKITDVYISHDTSDFLPYGPRERTGP